ncbi:MAG: hypothetical protein ACXAB7_06685 [Candidatus Kariarchaeaceae archaeon]
MTQNISPGKENVHHDELLNALEATKYTTRENLISLTIVLVTLFVHLIFTMALHVVPE